MWGLGYGGEAPHGSEAKTAVFLTIESPPRRYAARSKKTGRKCDLRVCAGQYI
jgi:hypothetical protein